MNDGGPAFPLIYDKDGQVGMSTRDYFAIHGPAPSDSDIATQQGIDRGRNPHNDHYKPKIRERDEIVSFLRYRFADAMLAQRDGPK